jgi:hypothetical protein
MQWKIKPLELALMIFRGDMLHPRWSQLVLLSSNTGIIPQGK